MALQNRLWGATLVSSMNGKHWCRLFVVHFRKKSNDKQKSIVFSSNCQRQALEASLIYNKSDLVLTRYAARVDMV